MARKDTDTSNETEAPVRDSSSNPPAEPTEPAERPTSGVTFTAEGGTPAQHVEFSDSQMVKQGEWKPETHGQPPDVRPKRNY